MPMKHNGEDLRVVHRKSDIARQYVAVRDSWPAFLDERAVPSSGISCMLVLIKTIYASLDGEFWDAGNQDNKERELRNPFLAFAWQDLTAKREMAEIVAQVWNTTLSQLPLAELAFEKIVSSDRMCETLWSNALFQPFATPRWRRNDSAEWQRIDGNTPKFILDFIQKKCPVVTPSNFRLEATPDMNLSEQVEGMFNIWGARNVKVAAVKSVALFFFATFDVKGVTKERTLSFEKIRTFTFRLPEGPVRDVHYNLSAIVFNRQQPADIDRIRVYGIDGKPRVPIPPQNEYAWSSVVTSQLRDGESFFALYTLHQTPPKINPSHPEKKPQGGSMDQCAIAVLDRLDSIALNK